MGTPRKLPQKKLSREDHSMIKLGKMLGEYDGLTPDQIKAKAKGTYRPRDGRVQREVPESPVARRKYSGLEDRDVKVQQQVSVMIQKSQTRIDAKSFQHHTEHIIMIRLGRLQRSGNLTFDKYTMMKSSHRMLMDEHVRFREIDTYDHSVDVFARLDEAVTKHPIIIELSLSGAKPRVSEQDKVIQVVVTQMLQETHVPVSDRDYKYHMEQIALIRLGNLLKSGTLTFHKYNTIKQQHVQEIKEALRNFEVDGYDWNTDIFTRLDFHIGIKERPSEADPMVIYGPEDDLGDQERKERDKVRDHFPDRERKQQEEEKIVITPANVSLRGKKVGPDEDEDEDGDDATRQRNKVKDHFPEREKKVKEEEKIVIKPANVSLRDRKKEEEEEKAKKEKEAKEAAEKARKEKEAKDAAEKAKKEAEEAAAKAKKEQEAKEAADKAKKEKEAKDAAEKAKKEEEAAEKAKKEQEAKEAAAKAKKEQEAKEAAEKARKEKEAKEAADKARRAKEAEEAAEKAKKEQEAKEAAEKAKKEEEEEEAAKAE